ncbi:tetratricopeptide repeat-containing sensor histidine kinase [Muricauda sp. SCSIO 64092]|uniref:tetratricopeptide repeat-containing sensor histidine kinase n=1 Tax=Allomuricauda sp. SCSIO 64092 TaxID=2908842 RepID=UPI001FF4A878|nr:tetratricopeptide repeat-containing sensor histidine kinase [Muricauda sp. SCSIO 64092]UOY06247.1 tetratricopeptide repeat-containing sensor histidine kinase [Muricauda sp. SCSIO 64092]
MELRPIRLPRFDINPFPYRRWFVYALLSILLQGHIHAQKKLTDSLIREKDRLEKRYGFQPTDTNYIKVLYKLGTSYIYQIPDSTKSISERVIHLSKESGFTKGLAGGKLGLGIYCLLRGHHTAGFKNIDASLELAKKVNADTIFLKGLNAKALGHFMKGDYPEAYLLCKEGERYAEEKGDTEMQGFFLMNLATAFSLLKGYEQALPYYNKALQLVEASGDDVQRAQIQANLGYLYLHTEDYEKAKAYCKKSLDVLGKKKYQAFEAFGWITMGEVAIREKKYDDALGFFTKSEALLLPIQDQQRKAETLQGMADTYYFKKDFTKSTEYAKAAKKIATNISYHQGIVRASELLYKLYLDQDQLKEALEYMQTAKHLSDSILESENKTKFLMLEAQAKFDREQELKEFENEKELARQRTITYISGILLTTLLIIILLIRKNAINQKKANLTLRELNKTKDRLFSIIGHDLKAPIGTLQELLELYDANEISEKDMAKFAPRLKQNVDHSSFTLNNLLYWAKTQMNGIRPNTKEVLVKPKAMDVHKLYSTKIRAKEINIQFSIDSDLKIMVDPVHLDIILRNVFSNAIKFTPEKGTIYFGGNDTGDKTEISVRDTGIGMNQETVKAITNGSIINSTPGTKKEKGTGIGLQIAQELIRVNKGSLKIESQLNKGSSIYLYFSNN